MEVTPLPAVGPDLDARERRCVNEILSTAALAYVAMVESTPAHGDTRPYVVPMNFAYEPPGAAPAATAPEGRLLLHTGPGRKIDALQRNAWVCISVTSQEQLKLGPTPCEDGYLYQSAVLEGRAVLVTDEPEREKALRLIVAKYDPEAAVKPFDPGIFVQTLVYAIAVETIGFKERPKRS